MYPLYFHCILTVSITIQTTKSCLTVSPFHPAAPFYFSPMYDLNVPLSAAASPAAVAAQHKQLAALLVRLIQRKGFLA